MGLPGVPLCVLAKKKKAAGGASVKVYLRWGKTLPSRERGEDEA